MKPRSQRGASMVELIIALPMFLMLIFVIAELSLIYQAKSILDMATLAAARAGAIKNGSTSVMRTAAAAAMAPLYAPGRSLGAAILKSQTEANTPYWIGSTNIIHTPATNPPLAGRLRAHRRAPVPKRRTGADPL